ncbi:hypothetical protein J3R82DRAFT_9660 [Butyriboletus roseoflavus]|nr:hypothetical protein J3R82DRAFT_9660 [Butyriboletus roseoflavus]
MLPQGDVASSVVCILMQWVQALVNSALIAWLDIGFMLVRFSVYIKLDSTTTAHAWSHRRIIVYSPQIIENYQLQSGEGLSLPFVYAWLLGDIFNLCGAALAHLLPTMIILGVYASACEYRFWAVYLMDLLAVLPL